VPTESGSFGDWLRRQRELREISLRDIAERTKISLRYLEAMEADRFDLLPAPIFAKGFLREYARYVGLSPDDVVNHYLSVHHPEELADPKDDTKVRARPKPVDPGQTPVRRNWSWGLLLALAGLILLVLVALAAYFAERRHDEPANVGQAPPMSAPPQLAAPGPDPMAVSIVLTLGNAGAVDVQVNGYPLELNRKEGDVVHDLTIDLSTVEALKAKKEAR
jgi:cytoskeletal protein RodZ